MAVTKEDVMMMRALTLQAMVSINGVMRHLEVWLELNKVDPLAEEVRADFTELAGYFGMLDAKLRALRVTNGRIQAPSQDRQDRIMVLVGQIEAATARARTAEAAIALITDVIELAGEVHALGTSA